MSYFGIMNQKYSMIYHLINEYLMVEGHTLDSCVSVYFLIQ